MIKFDAYEAAVDDVTLFCIDPETDEAVSVDDEPAKFADITGLTSEAVEALATFTSVLKEAIKKDLISIAEGL